MSLRERERERESVCVCGGGGGGELENFGKRSCFQFERIRLLVSSCGCHLTFKLLQFLLLSDWLCSTKMCVCVCICV